MIITALDLPKEAPTGDGALTKGYNDLAIESVNKGVAAKTGSHMLILTITSPLSPNWKTIENIVYASKENILMPFGLYQLRKLIEATGLEVPEEFSIDVLPTMLKGRTFRAELIEREYNGKTYLNLGKPDTYSVIMPSAQHVMVNKSTSKQSKPEAEAEVETKPETDTTLFNDADF